MQPGVELRSPCAYAYREDTLQLMTQGRQPHGSNHEPTDKETRSKTRKRKRALLRYRVVKWVTRSVAAILFGLSFLLFLFIVVPGVGRRVGRWSILNRPLALRLSGRVLSVRLDPRGKRTETAASGAVVEAGGFRTTCGSDGEYELVFQAEGTRGLPVDVRVGGQDKLFRITYPGGSTDMHKDFELE